jgi:biotin carboxylase
MAASIGVQKVSTDREEEIAEAFNAASTEDITEEDTRHSYDIAPDVVVEEYIPTYQEISCEGFVEAGRLQLVAITKKMLGPEPHFEEIGHVTPYPVPPEIASAVEDQLKKAVKALDLYSTAFHAEFRLRRDLDPVLIEIGARLPGGFIPLLVRLSMGVNMFDAILRLAAGQKYQPVVEENMTAAIKFLLSDDCAQRAVAAADRIRSLPFVRDLAIYGVESGRRGHIIWTADAFGEVEDAWNIISGTL